MSDNAVDTGRRQFLTGTASVLGGIGACFAAVPFIASFQPSEKAKAIGAPVEVDISKLESGQRIIAKWRGKPVWIVRRTPEMIEALKKPLAGQLRDPESKESEQPKYAQNEMRSKNPELLILVGICTHLGCSPTFLPSPDAAGVGENWRGGFFCPCHGSKFDLAGRVFTGVPAPTNLPVPPYKFLNDTRILIGEDDGGAA
ncbi:MAG: ubiquinol-cytochrome c reductase iron-sulfur subunit [Gammaproteobacteria bacterium]|nr:ubiquinol-cytochrome c reductase iron-sulfur subunit [Gammaproteobacteria bacterium]MBI5618553.1 ubiquinol-cytochrome c reductase iron-sulfur subunit [Gammaproteobacteria bacterium]